MAGRPTKYSTEMQYRLCIHLQHGATHRMAAEAEGIGLTTFDDWLRAKPDFREAVTRAEATARTELLSRMMQAATRGNVQAITWMLERLEPEQFGPPARRIEHSTPAGKPLEVTHTHEPERRTRVADILAEAGVIVARAGGLGDESAPDHVHPPHPDA